MSHLQCCHLLIHGIFPFLIFKCLLKTSGLNLMYSFHHVSIVMSCITIISQSINGVFHLCRPAYIWITARCPQDSLGSLYTRSNHSWNPQLLIKALLWATRVTIHIRVTCWHVRDTCVPALVASRGASRGDASADLSLPDHGLTMDLDLSLPDHGLTTDPLLKTCDCCCTYGTTSAHLTFARAFIYLYQLLISLKTTSLLTRISWVIGF